MRRLRHAQRQPVHQAQHRRIERIERRAARLGRGEFGDLPLDVREEAIDGVGAHHDGAGAPGAREVQVVDGIPSHQARTAQPLVEGAQRDALPVRGAERPPAVVVRLAGIPQAGAEPEGERLRRHRQRGCVAADVGHEGGELAPVGDDSPLGEAGGAECQVALHERELDLGGGESRDDARGRDRVVARPGGGANGR
jgi:hypothetical protein